MKKHFKSMGAMWIALGTLSVGGTTALAADAVHLQISQQASACKGTVKDATGVPVIGASVMVEGTTNGVITDLDGNFPYRMYKKAPLSLFPTSGTVRSM